MVDAPISGSVPARLDNSKSRTTTVLRWVPVLLTGIVAVVCLSIIELWASGYLASKSGNFATVPMAPLTAILLTLLCCAVLLEHYRATRKLLRTCEIVIITLILSLSLLIVAQSLNIISADIEQALSTSFVSPDGFMVGRMSIITASLFCVGSLSLFIAAIQGEKVSKLTSRATSCQ